MPFQVNERGLYVFVPHGPPKFKCTVIVNQDGELCHKPFHKEAEWLRHVAKCSREHEAEIMQAAPSHRLPGFYGKETAVADIEGWLDKEDPAGESNRSKVIAKRKKL